MLKWDITDGERRRRRPINYFSLSILPSFCENDDVGVEVGHHRRQEKRRRAINYLSFEVSTTATADSSPALFSFSKQKNLSHFFSLSPPRPLSQPSATSLPWVVCFTSWILFNPNLKFRNIFCKILAFEFNWKHLYALLPALEFSEQKAGWD